jgi:hypothetical protein
MRYKDKHFYTTTEHIKYLIDEEHMNDNEIGQVLREYWHCNNLDVSSILDAYYKKESEL